MPLEIKVKKKGNPSMKMEVKKEPGERKMPKRGERTAKNRRNYK